MSRTGALSENEIQTEMNKMVAFISQEAREKAREIQVKADEEFSIEKAKIVRQESLAIDAQYEKKRKQAEVGWKIAQSTALNNSRLQVLRSRNDHLETIFEAARQKVKDLSSGESYKTAMEALILEILLMLLSPSVTLVHRPKDTDLVKSAASTAQTKYKELSGRESKIEFEASLPDDSAGGVIGSSMAGRIKVDNTLDARLKILEEKMLPELRYDLFGANENRKFYTCLTAGTPRVSSLPAIADAEGNLMTSIYFQGDMEPGQLQSEILANRQFGCLTFTKKISEAVGSAISLFEAPRTVVDTISRMKMHIQTLESKGYQYWCEADHYAQSRTAFRYFFEGWSHRPLKDYSVDTNTTVPISDNNQDNQDNQDNQVTPLDMIIVPSVYSDVLSIQRWLYNEGEKLKQTGGKHSTAYTILERINHIVGLTDQAWAPAGYYPLIDLRLFDTDVKALTDLCQAYHTILELEGTISKLTAQPEGSVNAPSESLVSTMWEDRAI